MNILFLTTLLPSTKSTGGEVASSALIQALREAGHRVVVLGYTRPGSRPPPDPDAVAVAPRLIETSSARWAKFTWMLRSAVRQVPYSVAKFESREYMRHASAELGRLNPQVMILDHVQMAWVVREIRWSGSTVVVAHNVEHQMYREIADLKSDVLSRVALRREARLMRRWERVIAGRVDEIWTLTQEDLNAFQAMAAGTRVLRFDLPVAPASAPTPLQFDVGIMGTWTWQPNRAGLEWFLDKVVPLMPSGVSVRVAGRGGEGIDGRAPGVSWAGVVPDASEFLRSARVIAVPSVTGGGVQVKTLDAIASGRPVVATSVALRGIRDVPSYVLCSDDPAQFAANLARALEHGSSRDTATEGAAWARARCDRFRQAVSAAIDAFTSPR